MSISRADFFSLTAISSILLYVRESMKSMNSTFLESIVNTFSARMSVIVTITFYSSPPVLQSSSPSYLCMHFCLILFKSLMTGCAAVTIANRSMERSSFDTCSLMSWILTDLPWNQSCIGDDLLLAPESRKIIDLGYECHS